MKDRFAFARDNGESVVMDKRVAYYILLYLDFGLKAKYATFEKGENRAWLVFGIASILTLLDPINRRIAFRRFESRLYYEYGPLSSN